MKLTRTQLNNIIREALTEVEFHGETPEGELTGTEEEDARFKQQLAAERVMKDAQLAPEEIAFVQQAMQSPFKYANEFAKSPAYEKLLAYLSEREVMPYEVVSQDISAKTTPEMWILSYLARGGKKAGGGEKPGGPPGGFRHQGATVTDPRTGQVMHAKGLRESKITKSQIMQIIKEEVAEFLKESQYPLGAYDVESDSEEVSSKLQAIRKVLAGPVPRNYEGARKAAAGMLKQIKKIVQAEKDIDIPHRGATVTDPRTGQVMHAKGLKESKESKK